MSNRTEESRDPARGAGAGAGIGFVSAGVTAWQLAVMQWLGWVQWYHFAYLVIALALLGFGAAGTVLTLARVRWLPRWSRLATIAAALAAATMALAIRIAGASGLAPDLYLLFVDPWQIARLAGASLALACPFFFSGLSIGLVLTAGAARAGSLYAWNLAGSGAGGVAGWMMLGALEPQQVPALVSVLPLAGTVLLMLRAGGRGIARAVPVAGAAVVIAIAALLPGDLKPSQFKDISRLLDLPGARIAADIPDPRGRLQIIDAPVFRPAPPVSLRFAGEYPAQRAVLLDGNLRGSFIDVRGPEADASREVFDHSMEAAAWAVGPRGTVLFLESGGDGFAAWARERGAKRLVCVEPHPGIARELERVLPTGVIVENAEPREVLARGGAEFDVIRFPMAGAFGGTVGMQAVGEQFLFTAEAFAAALNRLTAEGVIVASAWAEQPERNAPRLLATVMEGLHRAGASDPRAHIAIIRSWNATTLIVKRGAMTDADLAAIRGFCSRLEFDPLVLGGGVVEGTERIHAAPGSALVEQIGAVLNGNIAAAESAVGDAFRLGPATDGRPYFSQFLKIGQLPRIAGESGWRSAPFVEMGYLVVALSAPFLLAAALVLVVAPLSRVGWSGGSRLATALFATGLGLGFMFVEIGLIARLTLFLGGAMTAAATVLTTLLVAAGAGSAFSQRFRPGSRTLARIALGVAAVCGALGLATSLAPEGWQASAAARMLVAALAIAPAAFVMGMAFPTLLRSLEATEPSHVPWAWAVNGCASVVAPSLAIFIAVNAGHGAVFAAAAAAYAISAMASVGLKPR
jgi:hypothetical protein